MARLLLLASLLALSSASLVAADKPAPAASKAELMKRFEKRILRDEAGGYLPYRLARPAKIEPGKKYPLVLFLHGAGERGVDNHAQLVHVVTRFVADDVQAKYPCFVVAPQCPYFTNVFAFAGRSAKLGVPAGKTYDAKKAEWQSYRIPVGQYVRGKQTYVTFIVGGTRPGRRGRPPARPKGKPAESWFRHVRIFERDDKGKAAPLDFRSCKPTGYGKASDAGAADVAEDGHTLHLTAAGGGWTRVKAALPYTVTDQTMLAVEFRSSVLGDMHAIGLDDDEEMKQGWWPCLDWRTHTMYDEPGKEMKLVLAMLSALRKELPIDASRLYVGGLSMGGYGTWDILMRHPKMFAAAFPICGGGDVSKASRIAHLPIWDFHGDKDGAVPVDRSRKMVAAIKAAGGTKIRYTEYPGVGHNSWDRAIAEKELIPWLFSQKRE